MVTHFEICKFQSVSGADNDCTVAAFDFASGYQFFQYGQGDASMWAREHASQISFRASCGKFIFAGLFDDSIGCLDCGHCFFVADGISDSNRVGQSFAGRNGNLVLKICFGTTERKDWLAPLEPPPSEASCSSHPGLSSAEILYGVR